MTPAQFMPETQPLGYAVVGLGHIAQRAVLPSFSHTNYARLAAVVSGNAEKAGELAVRFGAEHAYTYAAFDDCLRNPSVDAVYIATPNSMHRAFATRAAAAGKHVICEKPLATTVEDCREMIAACRNGGVKLMTAYRKYFEPAALELKALVASGKLGRLRIIHSAFTIFLPPGNSWHLSRDLAGGGSLIDLGIYCLSTVRWLTGVDPIEATARTWTTDPSRFIEVEDSIAFQLIFPEGPYMQGSSSFSAAKSSFLHIHGEKGWAALDPAYAYNEKRRFFGNIGGEWFERTFEVIDEFSAQIDYFSRCIEENHNPEPDGVVGLRDVAVLQAIYEAAKANCPVAIKIEG